MAIRCRMPAEQSPIQRSSSGARPALHAAFPLSQAGAEIIDAPPDEFENVASIAGMAVPSEIARHIAPLGWEHISLTGHYRWNTDDRPPVGQLRALRTPASLLGA